VPVPVPDTVAASGAPWLEPFPAPDPLALVVEVESFTVCAKTGVTVDNNVLKATAVATLVNFFILQILMYP
jgi:hypothetical protein